MARRIKRKGKQPASSKKSRKDSRGKKSEIRPTALELAFRNAGILSLNETDGAAEKSGGGAKRSGQQEQSDKREVTVKGTSRDQITIERVKAPPLRNKEPDSKPEEPVERFASDIREGRTQINSKSGGVPRDLVVGVDFGTSCTKVVFRDRELRQAYAIPLKAITFDGFPYYLPSRVAIGDDGVFSLETEAGGVKDIKLRLMQGPDTVFSVSGQKVYSYELVTGFLALILREARHWFFDNYSDVYSKLSIEWSLNIGVPSNSDDFQNVEHYFRKSAYAAWGLSAQAGLLDLQQIRNALIQSDQSLEANQPVDDRFLHPELVNAYPEVVAEAVGYARSDMRPPEGTLHLLVDIGAGTLDIATFILHEYDGMDRYSMMLNDVCQKGALILHQLRVKTIYQYVKKQLEDLISDDYFVSSIPAPNDYKVSQTSSVIKICDDEFLKSCIARIVYVLQQTRARRDPSAQAWREGLRVIICGGGSRVPLYQEAVRGSEERLSSDVAAFNYIELPKPARLEAELNPDEYHRMAVSYGLSHHVTEIGSTLPPEAIESIEPYQRQSHYTEHYIGQEQV